MTAPIKKIAKNICKKLKKDKDIRLAVVGITSAGKTYFLEDVVHLLTSRSFMGFESINNNQFLNFNNFLSDIRSSGFRLTQTPAYACRHKNQYSSALHNQDNAKFNFNFLDIPGDIIKKQNIGGSELDIYPKCRDLYNGIKRTNKKIFVVKTWTDSNGNTMKTVEYNDNKEFTIDAYDSTNNSYLNNAINKVRSNDYANKNDIFSYMNQHFQKGYEEETISGKEFIKDYYEFDADSAYQALVDLFHYLPNIGINLGISENQYKEYIAKFFYFYYFLFQATDIVLLQKILNVNTPNDNSTWFNNAPALTELNNDNPSIRFYLGIKGADTFLNKTMFKAYCDKLKNEDDRHNIIYSAAATVIGKKLGERTAITNELIAPIKTTAANKVREVAIPKDSMVTSTTIGDAGDALNTFVHIIGDKRLFFIPRHTYFIATPIDDEYTIDEFNDTEINGRSKNAPLRCYFGSLQLIEDILKARDKKIPDCYAATGKFLNFVRGTDRN